MMSQTPFRTFINLITFDKDISSLEQQVEKLKQHIVALENQEQELNQTLEQTKQQWHDKRKAVDEQELAMKELDEQLTEKNKHLDIITKQKEYKPLMAEIANLKQQQLKQEETLISIWGQLEAAQKAYKEYVVEHDKKVHEVHAAIEQAHGTINKLKTELDSHYKQRPEREKEVPEEWLEKYAAMRSRVTDPVVPAVNKNCSACFYIITEQDMLMLKRNKLLQCKGCFRFLYLEKPKEQSEEQSGT